MRYIEANPLRVGMVTDPADYRWSSFPHHGLGRADPLVSGFPEWEELGATEAVRRRRWRARVRGVQDEAELAAVRTSLRSGRPLGTVDWTGRVAERLNIDLKPRPADVLPRKNELTPIPIPAKPKYDLRDLREHSESLHQMQNTARKSPSSRRLNDTCGNRI